MVLDLAKKEQIQESYFLVGLGLLNLVAATLIICTIGFFFGIGISFFQIPLAFIVSLAVNAWLTRVRLGIYVRRIIIRSSLLIGGVVLISILIAGLFYDISYDGQWYHQETVIRLSAGWNPVYQKLAVPTGTAGDAGNGPWCTGVDDSLPYLPGRNTPPVNIKYLNINHFPKGIEIVETAIYGLTGKFETGKAVNLILLVSVFCLAWTTLQVVSFSAGWKRLALAFLIALNPISIIQLFTFCVDGALASVISILLLACCLSFRASDGRLRAMLGAAVILLLNLKFTGFLFTIIIGAGTILALIINRDKAGAGKTFVSLLTSGIIGVFICGFHPYLTNTAREKDPFYGIADTKIELQAITPQSLLHQNRFENLLYSLFSHTSDVEGPGPHPHFLKMPLAFNREDLKNAGDAEIKMAGFGPFFSAALILSLVLFIPGIRFRKSELFKITLFAAVVILVTIFAIPSAWWLRYAPQLWLIPVAIQLFSEKVFFGRWKLVRGLLASVLTLTVAWSLLSVPINAVVSSHIRYQLDQLQASREKIGIEYCPYRGFHSNRVRLQEANIPFGETIVKGPYIENIIHSNTRIETKRPLPVLPLPFLLRWKGTLPDR